MHELAIRSCFSGEGRSDAVGKCVSVRLKRGRKREKEREDISKVICMYVKKPMPLFHWKEGGGRTPDNIESLRPTAEFLKEAFRATRVSQSA